MQTDRRRPRIFVSSTCFDLRQARDGLRQFIEDELGYTALLSEMPSFPVDPEQAAIENCLRRVREDADVFVLLIGGRYGHVPDGARKSIVNLEYATARGAAIPVFAFIDDQVLPRFDAWVVSGAPSDSPDARLFTFIREIRQNDALWTFPFSGTGSVIETLRAQLAFRVQAALQLLHRLELHPQAPQLLGLPATALRLAVDREPGWAGYLLAELLPSMLEQHRSAREDFDAEVAIGPGEIVTNEVVHPWMLSQFEVAERLAHGLSSFINDRMTDSLACGDVGKIVRASRSIADAYSETLAWARRVRCAWTSRKWKALKSEISWCVRDTLNTIESIGPTVRQRLADAIASAVPSTPIKVDLSFAIQMHNTDRISELMRQAFEDRDDSL